MTNRLHLTNIGRSQSHGRKRDSCVGLYLGERFRRATRQPIRMLAMKVFVVVQAKPSLERLIPTEALVLPCDDRQALIGNPTNAKSSRGGLLLCLLLLRLRLLSCLSSLRALRNGHVLLPHQMVQRG